MEWCSITRDDLKQLNQFERLHPVNTIIKRDDCFIESGDVYRIELYDNQVHIHLSNGRDTIILTYEENGFEIHYDYGYNYGSQNTHHKYYTDDEGSYSMNN